MEDALKPLVNEINDLIDGLSHQLEGDNGAQEAIELLKQDISKVITYADEMREKAYYEHRNRLFGGRDNY